MSLLTRARDAQIDSAFALAREIEHYFATRQATRSVREDYHDLFRAQVLNIMEVLCDANTTQQDARRAKALDKLAYIHTSRGGNRF